MSLTTGITSGICSELLLGIDAVCGGGGGPTPLYEANFLNVTTLPTGWIYSRTGQIATVTGSDANGEVVTKFASNTMPYAYHSEIGGTGYLHEPNGTNDCLRSESHISSPWVNASVTSTGKVTSPDGSSSADSFTVTSASEIYQPITTVASSIYTASTWVKGTVAGTLEFQDNTGTVIASVALPTTGLWTRVECTGTSTSTTSRLSINPSASGSVSIWGSQLERLWHSGAVAAASSYIPTAGSTSSRSTAYMYRQNMLSNGEVFWTEGEWEVEYVPFPYRQNAGGMIAGTPITSDGRFWRMNAASSGIYDGAGASACSFTVTGSEVDNVLANVKLAWSAAATIDGSKEGRMTKNDVELQSFTGGYTSGTTDLDVHLGNYDLAKPANSMAAIYRSFRVWAPGQIQPLSP